MNTAIQTSPAYMLAWERLVALNTKLHLFDAQESPAVNWSAASNEASNVSAKIKRILRLELIIIWLMPVLMIADAFLRKYDKSLYHPVQIALPLLIFFLTYFF